MVFVNTVYVFKDNKTADKDYWSSDLPHPLSPSDDDVEIYNRFLEKGRTLMLGCTKKLIPLSHFQMDIDPWYHSSTVIKDNWLNNNTFYDNIIGDGVLSFTKELADDLIDMASKNCKVFIGQVGFLMHAAASVGLPSVIVYGGFEAPWQSGYEANSNLYSAVECAPCWLETKCPYGKKCMTMIKPEIVAQKAISKFK
jgi:hypothetical protein